uniref:Uncharacterized protein n=1 Tax=Solanum tuberosum TaxID=4113 RepID=M1DRM4_SOLTU
MVSTPTPIQIELRKEPASTHTMVERTQPTQHDNQELQKCKIEEQQIQDNMKKSGKPFPNTNCDDAYTSSEGHLHNGVNEPISKNVTPLQNAHKHAHGEIVILSDNIKFSVDKY